MSTRLE